MDSLAEIVIGMVSVQRSRCGDVALPETGPQVLDLLAVRLTSGVELVVPGKLAGMWRVYSKSISPMKWLLACMSGTLASLKLPVLLHVILYARYCTRDTVQSVHVTLYT